MTTTPTATVAACVLGCHTPPSGNPRQAAPGMLACHECADALRATLDDVERLYNGLDITPGHSGTQRRAPGYGPSSPAVDALVDHRDPRVVEGALATIEQWARLVRTDRSIDTPPDRMRGTVPSGRATMTRETATLRFEWHWIMAQPWVASLAASLTALQRTLQAARRETTPTVRIGGCPVTADGDDDACGRMLTVRPGDREIRCPRCDTVWTRDRWHQLGAPWADYATLAEQLGVAVGTLRRWSHEDGWEVRGTTSRRLVARADAVTSYAHRYGYTTSA